MLEEWCWNPQTLRMLSHHYSNISPEYMKAWRQTHTDAANQLHGLPEDLIQKLIQSKRSNRVVRCLALLDPSLYDMAICRACVQQTDSAVKVMDTTELFHNTTCKTYGIDIPQDLPPAQAIQKWYYTVDGLYVYLA
jgi:Zn-dependent oligopeptidase